MKVSIDIEVVDDVGLEQRKELLKKSIPVFEKSSSTLYLMDTDNEYGYIWAMPEGFMKYIQESSQVHLQAQENDEKNISDKLDKPFILDIIATCLYPAGHDTNKGE